jgi:hypothetical protein
MKRPDADPSLEALFPVINREVPIVFNANREIEIVRALDFAKEFNLKAMIGGGQEAWKGCRAVEVSKRAGSAFAQFSETYGGCVTGRGSGEHGLASLPRRDSKDRGETSTGGREVRISIGWCDVAR